MRHHAFAAAMGMVAAVVLIPGSQSQAASADPTGFWRKPDAVRESKIEVFKCGKAKSLLCAKIVWLKDPNDSKGRPLHDIRNEDPSMRDRPIAGLSLFNGFAQSAPGVWSGKIYNPEDGHTYAATLTLVSSKQIVLKGCKAWLLCGEKIWLRTSPPPKPAPEPEPQIEASVTPDATTPAAGPAADVAAATPAAAPEPAAPPAAMPAPSVEAAAAPEPAQALAPTVEAKAEPAALPPNTSEAAAEPEADTVTPQIAAPQEPAPTPVALTRTDVLPPAPPPAEQPVRPGYGFLSASIAPDTGARFSGENVSSMFVMTKPLATGMIGTATPPAGTTTAALPAAI